MTRRAAGLIVIVLVLLAAVTVPNAIGRTISGVPQATPVPGPPDVGDCVGLEFDLDWMVVGTDPSKYRYPELGVGACGPAHYGEVVSVIQRPAAPEITLDAGGSGMLIDDSNLDTCYLAGSRFMGQPSSGDHPSLLFTYWWAASFAQVVPLAPSPRQRAAGQHWLACGVYLTSQSDFGDTSLITYRGSLRDAESTGVGRDYRGICPREADWNTMTVSSCLEPHRGEILGYGSPTTSVARSALQVTCAQLVQHLTKSDVLGTGDLVVSVQATDMNGQTLTGATIPTGTTVQCGVVTGAGRTLKGSLLAIGSSPIPWA